ncbi:18092_t:CDS:1 [Dentiscutata erythropus]|uniref:18092_t:CDS:1 n=1 Tax=Dentiscutata erythropus TaxID=1348616 RepID=A0A9N9P1D9_9GLOM|nr:18092_t:CDS:1 [Dentiscutata erythropus]
MSYPGQQRQRRGFYVSRACTNCQQKHTKCSGNVICERCTLRNLECTFIDSGKKRGPRVNCKFSEQVSVFNGPENEFEGISMLSSTIPNALRDHASTLSSPSGYPQTSDNIDKVTLYSNYEEQNIRAFQGVDPFSYQACTDTGFVMQDNNIMDSTPINHNIIFLYEDLFFDNNYILPFHN